MEKNGSSAMDFNFNKKLLSNIEEIQKLKYQVEMLDEKLDETQKKNNELNQNFKDNETILKTYVKDILLKLFKHIMTGKHGGGLKKNLKKKFI